MEVKRLSFLLFAVVDDATAADATASLVAIVFFFPPLLIFSSSCFHSLLKLRALFLAEATSLIMVLCY